MKFSTIKGCISCKARAPKKAAPSLRFGVCNASERTLMGVYKASRLVPLSEFAKYITEKLDENPVPNRGGVS